MRSLQMHWWASQFVVEQAQLQMLVGSVMKLKEEEAGPESYPAAADVY
jgi:hypothetical protein